MLFFSYSVGHQLNSRDPALNWISFILLPTCLLNREREGDTKEVKMEVFQLMLTRRKSLLSFFFELQN
jgi:hypothetical protein